MKFSSLFLPETPSSDDSNSIPTFRVLMIYDTRQSAIRAKTAFDRLLSGFGGAFDFQYDLWRWDLLQIPETESHARWAGKIADLIVIATSNQSISASIQTWLRECIRRSKAPGATLVGLFTPEQESASFDPEMRRLLHPVAEGLGLYVHSIPKEKAVKPRVVLRDRKTTSRKSWDAKMAELESIHAEVAPEIRELRAIQAQQEYPFNVWGGRPSPRLTK